MISRFFIDRPVFASVISIVIALCGLVSITMLPIEQSPEITPPTVDITARYPGANAEIVAESVATPIEQELSGIEHLLYYQSQSSNDGSLGITLTFEIGCDLDIAAVETQNRLKRAEPRLPEEVIRQGISVNKRSNNILGVVALNSTDPKHTDLFLSNYVTIYMLDALKRVPGVGDALVFGGKDYSMRIWLDPNKVSARGMTVTEVADAIRDENGLYAAGRLGAPPNDQEVELTIPVITRGRLDEPEEFDNIILKANPDGSTVRLRDVGRVELGSFSYDQFGHLNGKPTTFVLIFLQPGANSLSTIVGLNEALERLKPSFPAGVSYDIPFNTTKYVRVSIEEVVKTFLEATGLVVLVVFVFLGSWRATIIPLLAIPVAIIGTFTGMLAMGFSINTLTLFGLVLAIGIVVDDAIVVVENVERIMHEDHLPPREATIKAMEQVTGPVIAIVLVLTAVYLPVAFLGGITGVMFRQFGITIAFSVIQSGVIALTLSPALCRLLLRPNHNKIFFFRWFDSMFVRVTRSYTGTVKLVIRFAIVSIGVFGALLYATYGLFQRVPSSFIPQEDQGYFLVVTMLPQGASLERTRAVMHQVEDFLLKQPEVEKVVSLGGQDFLAGRSPTTSAGAMFVNLKDWSERRLPSQNVNAIVGRVFGAFGNLKEATVLAFNPPAIRGLGFRAGFEMQLEGRGVSDVRKLGEASDALLGALHGEPMLSAVSGVLNLTQPQLYVDIDRDRAKALGLPIDRIYQSLQAYLGSLYVNDFNKYGRIFRVQVQAESGYRQKPEDLGQIYVRNTFGEMVPLSGVLNMHFQSGPNVVSRFNSYPSVQITGAPAPGISTGQVLDRIEQIAAKALPEGFGVDWSGVSFQERQAGNQAPYVILFGLTIVFLVLAAQYEKWSLPFAVMLAVPFGALGAVFAVYIRSHFTEMSRDIYFQIGLLTLVGLSAKNAILIVEFCTALHEKGMGIVEAALEAARIRLRPIVMTSLAFILGVLPLVLGHGAGAGARHSIGTGVMGGMLAATFLATLFVPLFFTLIQGLTDRLRGKGRKSTESKS